MLAGHCRGSSAVSPGAVLVRALVVLCAALLLGSCSPELSTVAERPPPQERAGAKEELPDPPAPPEVEAPDPEEVEVEPAPTPELTEPDPWVAGPAEVFPEAKHLASDTARGLTTYPHGSTPASVAEAAGVPHLADVLAGLVDTDAASAGTVVYPQMGGVTGDAVSVMVVVHQVRARADGGQTEETRTLDLRLDRTQGAWAVTALASDGGPPAGRPEALAPEAAAVLDHPRIELPDSARWDIHREEVDTDLLHLLLEIAEHHDIHAVTLSTGHPYEVFGTERQSNHTLGRAVDIYAVDGVPVSEQRHEGSAVHGLVMWLYGHGVPELGSPWALDGHGGRSFTDEVHQDHLHIGILPPAAT